MSEELREKLARIVKGARLSAAFGREFRSGDGRLDDVDLDAADNILALIDHLEADGGVEPESLISVAWTDWTPQGMADRLDNVGGLDDDDAADLTRIATFLRALPVLGVGREPVDPIAPAQEQLT